MDRGVSQDDPFSDWWIIWIEEKIDESDTALTEIVGRA